MIGAVAVADSVTRPPNRSPMIGVMNVNGWLADTRHLVADPARELGRDAAVDGGAAVPA